MNGAGMKELQYIRPWHQNQRKAPVKLKVNLESRVVSESSTQDSSKPILAVFKFRK